MPTAVKSTSAAPRRRAAVAKSADKSAKSKSKKLSAAAVEATAAAFMAGFKALPGAVQWRIVQLLEAEEDEADARELEAIQMARPADYNPENLITLEDYMAQRQAREQQSASAGQRLAA